ncbi:DUF3429 domain-containing protein [Aquibium carbonis]|uniref:DUF3429 domain-containing protein n=1 Tax=Aquibium carbonis TaxID=2495581 RepID=A0A3S0A1U4_9HYPH|nr:DUF3429 domain-containing protein [Aquibium carbonis]RST86913.1 DUF3429 domain-containing protein [Aquibium carbonis]
MDERSAKHVEQEARTESTARFLALFGFVPILVLVLWLTGIDAEHEARDATLALLKSYCAIILSFLGGIRWGLGMVFGKGGTPRDLVASCIPPLVGWGAFFAPEPYTFGLFAAAFAAQGAWDNFAVHARVAPRWYGRLRILLTVLVAASMMLAFVATA